MTKLIKQRSKYTSVAAMTMSTTVKGFKKFVKQVNGPHCNLDIYKYLLHKSYSLGIGLERSSENTYIDTDSSIMGLYFMKTIILHILL